MTGRRHVVVVGGGIAGLTVAYRLVRSSNGIPIEVTVLEARPRAGGKLRTIEVGGIAVEAGADSFVVRKPWAVELCKELGLGGELVVPGALGASVWTGGRLIPFPERSAFGIPTDVERFLRWPGLPLSARLRVVADLLKRARQGGSDESLGSLVERRLGRPALDGLVGPLLAGLHAGDPDRLSVQATFPELQAWERGHDSLIRGARAAVKARPEPGDTTPGAMFATVWGGLSRLVESLETAIGPGRIRRSATVSSIRRAEDSRRSLVVEAGDAEPLAADAVVLATPAFESAKLARGLAPDAAGDLERIPYVSTAVVVLVYPAGTAERLPDGTGFVVPLDAKATITACTWLSNKWPQDEYGDRAVLRCFVGRAGHESAVDLPDDDLVSAVRADAEAATPLGASPEAWRVVRWIDSMPQYEVGHIERVARIEGAMAATPGLFVTGSAYRGVGIADCVKQAGRAAAGVRAYLHSLPPAGADHDTREVIPWTS